MKADQELRSLKRGLKALAYLNQVETVSVTALARHLELPRTTAERVLMTLAAEGYVERVPNDKRYRLSAKVTSLASGFSSDCWTVHIATPLLLEATRQIGWPLGIATPEADRMVLRATSDPATTLWLARRRVGAMTPILGSSSGLVAFAFTPRAEREQLLTLLRSSPDAINRVRSSSDAVLHSFIEPVMSKGYAFQPPPNDMPERSLSVPIFIDGQFAASLLLIYMSRAMSNATAVREYLPMLRDLATDIGQRISVQDNGLPQALPNGRFSEASQPVLA